MIKLVVGVGNPGNEYELTRHNIAWLAMDNLSYFDDLIWKNDFKGEWSSKNVKDEKRFFLKPMTYMNLSGESVQPLAHFYKISPEEILVVQDEIDLPYGEIQFKNGGGLAGHNGLKSIAQRLGTQNFMRLRLGVGRPDRGSVSSWVLKSFGSHELDDLGVFLKHSAESIEYALEFGYQKAANKFSKKNIFKD